MRGIAAFCLQVAQYDMEICFSGVDLHALEQGKDAGSQSDAAVDAEDSRGPDWVPDWTRSALGEVFGPLAETAVMLHMTRVAGQSDEAEANVGGK